jgi:hypothetical protein
MLDGERTPDFGLVAPVPQMPIEVFPRATAPPLPPSPVSIPSSPSRKRPREMEPRPQTPPNIPDHLPPFPRISAVTNELERRSPSPMASIPAVVHPPAVRPENLATSSSVAGPALQASTQASAADYTTPVHYEASSLRDVPEWHLPQPPLSRTTVPKQQLGLATPQTQPSLLAAYHHVLTHPPAKNAVPAANPSRHRIALGLIEQSERQPRWEPPDTLFGSSVPPMPQVARSAPTFPMAITKPPNSPRHELASDSGGKDKLPLPTVQNRSLIGSQRIVPLITQQGSRIPDISRNILTVGSGLWSCRRITELEIAQYIQAHHSTQPSTGSHPRSGAARVWTLHPGPVELWPAAHRGSSIHKREIHVGPQWQDRGRSEGRGLGQAPRRQALSHVGL